MENKEEISNAKNKIIEDYEDYDIQIKIIMKKNDQNEAFKISKNKPEISYDPSKLIEDDNLYEKMSLEYGKFIWEKVVQRNSYSKIIKNYKDTEEEKGKEKFARDLHNVMTSNLFIQSISDLLEDISENQNLLKNEQKKIVKSNSIS